jgi:hypothetical protein
MSNTITIELCAEDRARLDKLTAALEKAASGAPVFLGVDLAKKPDTEQLTIDPEVLKAAEPTEAPKNATGEAEASAPPVTPTTEEKPTAKEDAPAEPVKPTVTLEQIQQKVVQLAAGNGGAKKAKVREIINAYGAKVSDLKDQPEKWTEVWDKLTALESEG